MGWVENIQLAFRSLTSNWLRAILTILIIALGIMALVGILTAIDSAIYSLSSNLSSLGGNTFTIDEKGEDGARGNRRGRQTKIAEPFVFSQAMAFKNQYEFDADASVSMWCSGNATVKYKEEKTNPNFQIFAIDENYLTSKGYEVAIGRNFSAGEALNGGYQAIVGNELVKQLFNGKVEKAINSTIQTGNIKLLIIGVLKERGSGMNDGQDRRVLIPLQTGKQYFGSARKSYNILVAVNNPLEMDQAIGQATMIMRNVRGLKAGEENDFTIEKSESTLNMIKENTRTFQMGAIGIGMITLLGAAIGLMNIMLVSVTERTKEIGLSKAIGATPRTITIQFLMEAVVISQIGGLLGIVLGVLIGNVVTMLLGGSFLFPWLWITVAFITCTFVGLASGLYPALKAAYLDPIESLRHE